MFGAFASPPPPVTLKRSRAAAVTPAAAESRAPRASRGVTIWSVAAAALGISAVIGGGLLLSRRKHRSEKKTTATTQPQPLTPTSSTLWGRLAHHLHFFRKSANDDDEDAFANGTGASHLFDEARTKARLQARNSKKDSKQGQPSSKSDFPTTATATRTPSEGKRGTFTAASVPEGMEVREQYIKIVRALLQREAGLSFSDDDDDSASSSDSTDVSLNYHLATAMEGHARDDLLMAFAEYEHLSDGDILGTATSAEDEQQIADLQTNVLVKMLEYLDMSNEREKLRCRRIDMYHEDGRATPISPVDMPNEAEEDDEGRSMGMMMHRAALSSAAHYHGPGGVEFAEEEDEGADDHLTSRARQARRFEAMMLGPSMMGMPADARTDSGGSVLDRILGQEPAAQTRLGASKVPLNGKGHPLAWARHEDVMEHDWEMMDEEEEDFMAYLQQADDAPRFFSRQEMRQVRHNPDGDMRVVGNDADLFGEAAEDEWEDEDATHENSDGEGMEDVEDDESMLDAVPWSRQDKAEFERELLERIHHLANSHALTAAMAEREVQAEEARKHVARQQRQQKDHQSDAGADATAGVAGAVVADAAGVDDDDGGWEDCSEEENAW